MANEKTQTEVSTKEDFWNSSAGDPSVDAVAAVVAESVKEDDLEEEKKVEESDSASDSTTGTEKAEEKTEEKSNLRFDSLEKYEEAYRSKQSAVDKNEARIKELEGQLTDHGKVNELMDKLGDALADVDDPDVQAAIQAVKTEAGHTVLDRSRVDPKAATEIERHIQAQNDRIARLEAGLSTQSAEEKVAENKAYVKQLETDYPFAATIKEDAGALLTQYNDGKLTVDEVALKLAEIGWKAGRAGGERTKTVKDRAGSDAGGTPGKVTDGEAKKTVSDAEVLTGALLKAANSRESYV